MTETIEFVGGPQDGERREMDPDEHNRIPGFAERPAQGGVNLYVRSGECRDGAWLYVYQSSSETLRARATC